jgi:hypothetical protein
MSNMVMINKIDLVSSSLQYHILTSQLLSLSNYYVAMKLHELLQTKGADFSEDINGHYVKMCIKYDRLDIIVKDFTIFKNRLAAWTSDATFER